MDTGAAENADAEAFLTECFSAWDAIAPSYVKANVRPLDGHLRDLHAAGATAEQFREALEVAFVQPGVTKRQALRYAYGIIRRHLEEGTR